MLGVVRGLISICGPTTELIDEDSLDWEFLFDDALSPRSTSFERLAKSLEGFEPPIGF